MQHMVFSYNGEYGARDIRAPANKMFAVHGALFANFTAISNSVAVMTRQVEERAIFNLEDDNPIFAFRCEIDGEHVSIMLPKPERAKHLTILTANTNNIGCHVIIYYEIVDASKSELIWDFLRRGKNP